MSKSFSHEKFKFLFMGQGQVDNWHHLRGISKAFSSSNLEFNNKMTISHKLNQFRMVVQNQEFNNSNYSLLDHFAWLWKNFTWSCEISLAILLCLQHNSNFWSILHSHAKWKYLIFKFSFVISSISLFWFHFNCLQINSKSRPKCIDFSSSSTLFALLNSISLLLLNLSKSYLEMTPKLHKTC